MESTQTTAGENQEIIETGAPAPEAGSTPEAPGAEAAEVPEVKAPAVAPEPAPEKPVVVAPEVKDAFKEKLDVAYKAGPEVFKAFMAKVSVDYDNMAPDDLFRENIRKENPGASDKLVEVLLKNQLAKYEALGFGEDDLEAAAEMRERDANKVRDDLKAEQAAYTPAAAPAANPEAEAALKEQQEKIKEFQESLDNHPVLKEFEMNPVLEVGNGEEAFNYEVPKTLDIRATLDGNTFYSKFFSKPVKDKAPVFDMKKWARVMAYAENPDKFEAALLTHGKTLGSKAEFESRHNPDTEIAAPAPTSGSSTVRAWRD